MLKIENVSKKLDKFQLKNISFEIKKGYVMGIIGHNGAGKTTLIKLIMNLLKKDSGKIYFDNEKINDLSTDYKQKIGFVYDNLYFYSDLKICEYKNIMSRFYNEFNSDKFDDYLNRFALSKDMKIKSLSKGENIKLMLANALTHNAKLLVLDEPTSGLDPVIRKEVLNILQEELKAGDKSVIFSTHITQDLEKYADYITFICNGELVFSENRELITEKYKIVKGSKSELDELGIEFINRKDAVYFSEGLFSEELFNEENNMNSRATIKSATLDEILYYYKNKRCK